MTSLYIHKRKCDFLIFPGALRHGGLCVIEWVSTKASCLHLRGSLIMSQWQSPCPCRPGPCDPPFLWWITQFTKNDSQVKPRTTIFLVECQFCPPVLGKPSALKSQSKIISHPTITVIIHGVHCTTYFRWETRVIPDYWSNSWCTAWTVSVGLVSKHQIHCIQVDFVPNVLQEYFEINTSFHRLIVSILFIFYGVVCLKSV